MKLTRSEVDALTNSIYWKGRDHINDEVLKTSKTSPILKLAMKHSAAFNNLPDYIKGRDTWTIRECAYELAKTKQKNEVKSRAVIESEVILAARMCKAVDEIKKLVNPIVEKKDIQSGK